jgi:hypothetical protein
MKTVNDPTWIMGVQAYTDYDSTSRVACGSDSMGLTVDCNDLLLLESVTPGEVLEGEVYTFQARDGNRTVHRAAKCFEEYCVFRGDNNAVGEVVQRVDVTHRVTGVVYR